MAAGALSLDKQRIRELFDLRTSEGTGIYDGDPYPEFRRLRETGPVHEGTVHRLIGFDGDPVFTGLPEPDRRHFSVFSFTACDKALRDGMTFWTSPHELRGDEGIGLASSIMYLNGVRHRHYRALAQPAFVPARSQWWTDRWISETVHALIDSFEGDGRADLNIDLAAPLPILSITRSFGIDVEDALEMRSAVPRGQAADGTQVIRESDLEILQRILMPIIDARRSKPQDDVISVLCAAETPDEDGIRRLSDDEIFSFSHMLIAAGSGTTWKQLGITLSALLARPEVLDRVRADRSLVRPAIEESVRWMTTDPMFARYARRDVTLCGTVIPAGSVLHVTIGAANRDPSRWERPDDFDIWRPALPTLGFGSGMHVCIGMHVARAEIAAALNAALDRLPNLRLDPDADAPRIIGMYERGPDQVPVVWG